MAVKAARDCRTRQEPTVNYTHYDYLELAPGASRARIEAAYAALLERFSYARADGRRELLVIPRDRRREVDLVGLAQSSSARVFV